MDSCKTCKHWNQPNPKYPWGDCSAIPAGEAMIAVSIVGDDEIFKGAEIAVETYEGFSCGKHEPQGE